MGGFGGMPGGHPGGRQQGGQRRGGQRQQQGGRRRTSFTFGWIKSMLYSITINNYDSHYNSIFIHSSFL